jgi:hypothetical protein
VQILTQNLINYSKLKKEMTMKTKQTLTTVCSAAAISLVTSTAALASSGATNKVFVSGPLILLFLGFCALVVVVQCIPAVIMFYGMIKGIVSSKEKASVKS